MNDLKYSYSFDPAEENNTAATIAKFALSGGSDVLDIGSGPAWVSRYLAAEHGRTVTCLDNDIDALASLDDTALEAFEADLESDDWDSAIEGRAFDVVIIADVLEHLRAPGRLLERLIAGNYLRDDGKVVISVPNASHAGVVSELLLGDFRYTETGILDETHIRWFTLQSLTRLLERNGYVIERVERTVRMLEHTPSGERSLQIPAEIRTHMKSLNPESETYQFIVLARPDSAGVRAAAEAARFDAERRTWWNERGGLIAEVRKLRAELEGARSLLVAERSEFDAAMREGAEELARREARIDKLKGRVRTLRERADRFDREIQELRATMYFRARSKGGAALRRLGLRK